MKIPSLTIFQKPLIWLLALFSGMCVQAHWDQWVFQGTITAGLPGSPYAAGLSYDMSFLVPSHLEPVANGVYGTSGSASFQVGSAGAGGNSSVFVVNDQVLSDGRTFDGVIYSLFGGGFEFFGPATPFDGSVDGITLVGGSTEGAGGVFTDTRLPRSIDLNQFPLRFASIRFGYAPDTQTVRGTVDRLYINGQLASLAVPEPSIGILLVFSCALFWLIAVIRGCYTAAR